MGESQTSGRQEKDQAGRRGVRHAPPVHPAAVDSGEPNVGLHARGRASNEELLPHPPDRDMEDATTRKRAIDNMDTNGAPDMWCVTTI